MQGDLTCEQPSNGEYASGNIFLRKVTLAKKFDKIHGHKHNFDHTTFVTKGRVHVLATCPDGCAGPKEGTYGDGKEHRHFLVKANWLHEITALEDDVEFYCIYSHRDAQGNVVQEAKEGLVHAYL